MRSLALITAAMIAAFGAPQLASAKGKPPPPPPPTLGTVTTPCSLSDISPGALACVGWYPHNLNDGSPDGNTLTDDALSALFGTTVTSFTVLKDLGPLSGPTIDFGQKLYGDTVVSFHVGAAKGDPKGVGYESTAFYEFNAGIAGISSLTFNRAGLSNARLFSTGDPCTENCGGGGVPEPASWALMLVGFGGLGAVMRSRRKLASAA